MAQIRSGPVELNLHGWVEGTLYTIDGHPPALLHADPGDDLLLDPRLALTADLHLGDHIFGFAKARWDNGLDAGYHDNQVRLDEYLLRADLRGGGLSLQAGKFATVFGGFAGRHDPWENPFVTAPLLYENVTSLPDFKAASAAGFSNNRNAPNNPRAWVPVVWGPGYSTGFASFGSVADQFGYALAIKSHGLSSRPDRWEDWDLGEPSLEGRVSWEPSARWTFGTSFARGPWLGGEALPTLPQGSEVGDFPQTSAGIDAAFVHGHLQIRGELVYSEFDLPLDDDDAEVLSWYLEGRYRISPSLYAALRYNHQVFNTIGLGGGRSTAWDNDLLRLDAALGIRLGPDAQLKLQYSWTHQDADFQVGENLVALQVVYRF